MKESERFQSEKVEVTNGVSVSLHQRSIRWSLLLLFQFTFAPIQWAERSWFELDSSLGSGFTISPHPMAELV